MTFGLFLSHSWVNKDFVEAFKTKVEAKGVKCWIDTEQMPAGSALHDEIQKGLKNSRVFVAFISEAYVRSDNCNMEFSLAVDWKKPIIPVKLTSGRWPPEGNVATGLAGKLYLDGTAGVINEKILYETLKSNGLLPSDLFFTGTTYINNEVNNAESSTSSRGPPDSVTSAPAVAPFPQKDHKHLTDCLNGSACSISPFCPYRHRADISRVYCPDWVVVRETGAPYCERGPACPWVHPYYKAVTITDCPSCPAGARDRGAPCAYTGGLPSMLRHIQGPQLKLRTVCRDFSPPPQSNICPRAMACPHIHLMNPQQLVDGGHN